MSKRVSVIGNGNWGTTIARLLAINTAESNIFDSEVRMWGHHELYEGKVLNDVINSQRENPKYLPGIHLPDNLQVVNDLRELADSDVIVVALPHQYISAVEPLKGLLKETCIGVSLTKGFILNENGEIGLVSAHLQSILEINFSVVMGANIANEVAEDEISEGTLAYNNDEAADIIYKLFNCYSYRVTKIKDIYGVELSGTLKNIISMAYGFAEGLGYCTNTKAAIFRNGLAEMKKFFKYFYPMATVDSLFQSSGVGDLLVSCFSGRNKRCAKIMAEKKLRLEDVEKTMCCELQGPETAKAAYAYLEKLNRVDDFPIISTIYKICYKNEMYDAIIDCISPESVRDQSK